MKIRYIFSEDKEGREEEDKKAQVKAMVQVAGVPQPYEDTTFH